MSPVLLGKAPPGGAAPASPSVFPAATAAMSAIVVLAGLAFLRPTLFGAAALPALGATGPFALATAALALLLTLFAWTRVAVAAPFPRGTDEAARERALRVAVLAFLLTEAAAFAAVFAAYLHFAVDPGVAGLTRWPPAAIRPASPWGGPLLNTAILLASGAAAAAAHEAFMRDRAVAARVALLIAIALGLAFLGLQTREFTLAAFGYRDGVYPSIFFFATGLHGVHVVIGLALLSLVLARLLSGNLVDRRQVGFELSVWYWHFVDAVWLLLFLLLYAWAG